MPIWVGMEPTFTDRSSHAREWLSEALGGDKEARARALLQRLLADRPGALALRTLGRQYGGEKVPRWSYGLYVRRDGVAVWEGPPDDLEPGGTPEAVDRDRLLAFAAALVERLRAHGWTAARLEGESDGGLRVVFRCDGDTPTTDSSREPRLARASVHDHKIPVRGLVDDLAAQGEYLVVIGPSDASVELPSFADVSTFLAFADLLGRAATETDLRSLTIRGFPPPVDDTIAWTTLTPDPAVLEVNMAPAEDVTTFLKWTRELFALAHTVGLSPYRCQYNGTVTDSGGGGQITIGGPSPELSPFLVAPRVLPRLIRYLVRHPSLSYWFATNYIGGSSQSPRPDERERDSLTELGVALDQIEQTSDPSPEFLWDSLRHFLADSSGNPHRSELNIEKLWNPHLPGRGRLGLVEFRAFRMARTPERAAAIAALVRALVGMLSTSDPVRELVRWEAELHDRFALPYYLRIDLDAVLADLRAAGFGLSPALVHALFAEDEDRVFGELEHHGAVLRVERALEFWPLLGDVASQEEGGSRLVDASTSRLEVTLSLPSREPHALEDWELSVDGYRVPLRGERTESGLVGVIGVRYRGFKPFLGMHPSIRPRDPIALILRNRPMEVAVGAKIHAWRADGSAYPGLPETLHDCAARRAERFIVQPIPGSEVPRGREAPSHALSAYCFDLRRVE